jgi:hypothetical protein
MPERFAFKKEEVNINMGLVYYYLLFLRDHTGDHSL